MKQVSKFQCCQEYDCCQGQHLNFQIYGLALWFSGFQGVLESSLQHNTQRSETWNVSGSLPIDWMITSWWMPSEIIFIVNIIICSQQRYLDIKNFFLLFRPFGNHSGVGEEHFSLIQALSFLLLGETKAGGAKPYTGFWREEHKQTKRSWWKEYPKRQCRLAHLHPHPEMYYKLNNAELCDRSYIMKITQTCCPWSSESFRFKMHANVVQVYPPKLPN